MIRNAKKWDYSNSVKLNLAECQSCQLESTRLHVSLSIPIWLLKTDEQQ